MTELQEILEVCDVSRIESQVPKLFKRIVKCISGSHLQIADRAMCFFENDFFINILKQYKDITFPMIVPSIVNLAENHWHSYFLRFTLGYLKNL